MRSPPRRSPRASKSPGMASDFVDRGGDPPSASIRASSAITSGPGAAANSPGITGRNWSSGKSRLSITPANRASTLSDGSDPFQPAYVSQRIGVNTTSGWRRYVSWATTPPQDSPPMCAGARSSVSIKPASASRCLIAASPRAGTGRTDCSGMGCSPDAADAASR